MTGRFASKNFSSDRIYMDGVVLIRLITVGTGRVFRFLPNISLSKKNFPARF